MTNRYQASFDLALAIVAEEISDIVIIAPGSNAAWDECARSIYNKLRLLYVATFDKEPTYD